MLPAWHIVGDLQIVVIRNHHLKQFLGRESKDELTRYVDISPGGLSGEMPPRSMGGILDAPHFLLCATEGFEIYRVLLMGFIISGP